MDNTISLEKLISNINEFVPIIKSSLIERWNEWDIKIEEQIKFEVIGGILSRQVSIVIQFIESVSIWNGDIGTIILRSLADNYITIAWILKKDTLHRCEMFVEHGIGQAVLYLEKLKEEERKRELNKNEKSYINSIDEFIKHERNIYTLDVNVGAWANINTRGMAEEANCKNFYDFVFTPFSFSAHSTWNHIIIYNMKETDNPMHNYIKIPTYKDLAPDLHWPNLAIKYLDMCYEVVDNNFNTKTIREKLEKIFVEIMNKY